MPIHRILPASLLAISLNMGVALGQEGNEAPATAMYRRECASCHQLDGAPVEAIERLMRVTMRHLGAADVQAKSDDELGRDVAEGFGKMRAFTNLSGEQVAELVSYMRSLAEP